MERDLSLVGANRLVCNNLGVSVEWWSGGKGGGNVCQVVIGRLQREAVGFHIPETFVSLAFLDFFFFLAF